MTVLKTNPSMCPLTLIYLYSSRKDILELILDLITATLQIDVEFYLFFAFVRKSSLENMFWRTVATMIYFIISIILYMKEV